MTTVPLNESGVVVLDASGNGTAKIGPLGQGETWNPAVVHVKTAQAPAQIVNEAQCFIYAGGQPVDSFFADSTSSGSTGDSTDSAGAYPIGKGEWIWAVWSGGDAGAEGIVRVTGTKVI